MEHQPHDRHFDLHSDLNTLALARNNVNEEAFCTADLTRITAIILSLQALRGVFGI